MVGGSGWLGLGDSGAEVRDMGRWIHVAGFDAYLRPGEDYAVVTEDVQQVLYTGTRANIARLRRRLAGGDER